MATDTMSTTPSGNTAWFGIRETWRTFRIAARLGWQVEGNWADPLVFFIFAILRPLASALILLLMYQVIAGGQRGGFFNYLYMSNAFFVLVIEGMSGMAWAVMDDRENYKMLKYIYTSPARKFAYLLGRSVAKVSIGLLTSCILLLVGGLFLGLRVDLGRVQLAWLPVYFVLGLVILASLGLVLAGVALVVARHGGAIGEVTAGALLLFSGAYFPIDVLPPVLRDVSVFNPISYWLEGMRRALAGGSLQLSSGEVKGVAGTPFVSPSLAAFDNWQLLAILVGSAVVSAIVAYFFYNWVEHQAKERGMIDRLTGY